MRYLFERLTLRHYMIGVAVVVGSLLGLFLFGIVAKAAYHEITKERPHFSSGKIVDKDFDPAHYDDYTTQQYMGETCYGTGDNRTCQDQYVTIWHHDYVPDSWSVRIENCHVLHKTGELWVDKQGNAKCFKKWIDVDHGTFDHHPLGSQYA